MLTSLDYVSEIEVLNENKKVCVDNDTILELQMMIVSALLKDDNKNENLLRLQTKVNDRYFINQEMINVLNRAIKHLKEEKQVDAVYCNYLDKYHVLAKRIIAISKDEEFRNLAELYLPKQDEVNQSL